MGRIITRAELVAAGRSWVGTPVVWQQCRRGSGVDCKFLMAGIAHDLDLDEAKSLAAQTRSYRRAFSPQQLIEGLDATLIRTVRPGPGDVAGIMLWPRRDGPRHLAMLSDQPGWVIHAYGAGFNKVAEVPLGGDRKVWGYWTWPSLAAAGERLDH